MRQAGIIIEEDANYADALAVAIEKTCQLNIVRRFEGITDAFINIRKHRPVMIILGNCEDPVRRSNAIQLLRRHLPELKFVVVLGRTDRPHLMRFIKSGVSGVFPRDAHYKTISATIQTVLKGDQAFDKESRAMIYDSIVVNNDGLLTPREQDVLLHLSLGKTYKMICEELNFTRGSLVKHISNLYGKLNVHTRADAIKKAVKHRYLVH